MSWLLDGSMWGGLGDMVGGELGSISVGVGAGSRVGLGRVLLSGVGGVLSGVGGVLSGVRGVSVVVPVGAPVRRSLGGVVPVQSLPRTDSLSVEDALRLLLDEQISR